MSFVEVTEIRNISPAEIVVGQPPVNLSASVRPPDATNSTIEWELVSGPGTITSQGAITATAAGNIVVRARIRNGIIIR